MSDKCSEMLTFVRIAALGSFSAAARSLKLTPSAVSKTVARLEERLSTQLVDRSSRSLRLTHEGEVYYKNCMQILDEIEEVERSIRAGRAEPRGQLRVNSSIPIGRHQIIPLIPEFLERYPLIELDLSLSDQMVNLLDDQVDVAIRIGPLQDSSLRARIIATFHRVVVASPLYIARHGSPRQPADLAHHNCLGFNFKSNMNQWPFRTDSGTVSTAIAGNFRADNGETLREMCIAGVGIARLATFMIDQDIRTGRLVPLLETFQPDEELGVYAVFSARRFATARARCFLDFLVDRLSSSVRRSEDYLRPVLAQAGP